MTKLNWWADLHLLRIWVILSTCLVLAALIWMAASNLLAHREGPPTHLARSGNEILALDSAGHRLWSYALRETPRNNEIELQRWFGHLKDALRVDTLFVSPPLSLGTAELVCVDENGQIRWKFRPGRAASDANRPYPPFYTVNQFLVMDGTAPNRSRIVVNSGHAWSYPDEVAVLDPDGVLVGEYWHAGKIASMAKAHLDDDSSTEILLGGIDEVRQRAMLIVLDVRNLRGSTAGYEKNSRQSKSSTGPERAVVWFERSLVNEMSADHNYASGIDVIPGGIVVKVEESRDGRAYLIYMLDQHLNVTQVEPSEDFRAAHLELEHAGKINHPLDDAELATLRRIRVFRQ